MPLNIVPDATFVPGYCAASGSTSGPFVDTGFRVREADARIYLSLAYLRTVAADLGYVSRDAHEDVLIQNEALMMVVEQMASRIERFDEDIQNVADAMVAWLGVVKARTDVAAEVEVLAGAVDNLCDVVESLEGE